MKVPLQPIKTIAVFLAFIFISLSSATAQKINYNSETAKAYPLADKVFCQRFADDFVYSFNYILNNTKNFKDNDEIKRNAVAGDKEYHEKANLKFTPYTFKVPDHLRDVVAKNTIGMSAALKSFLTQVNTAIDNSTSYEQFSASLVKLSKVDEFNKLGDKDKKIASGIVVSLEYAAQVIPDLLDKLGSKLGRTDISLAGNASASGTGPSDAISAESNDADFFVSWRFVAKCALGTLGGAGAGALGGAAAGATIAGVGAVPGAIIGAVAGGLTGAAGSCF